MGWCRLWTAVLLLATSCGSSASVDQFLDVPAAGTPPTPLIVDYSPTVSDVNALLFLLSHPRVDVLAISMSEAGEAGCTLGVEVTLGILAMFDREDIPVACDPDVPDHVHAWPAEFLAGHEKLLDGLPIPTVSASGELPSDLIARVAAESPRPVVVYAVEPLTVVAKALADHPLLADDIEQIVIMGGAVNVPGNVFDSNVEWNLYIDAQAAEAVIGSGIPVTLVPLDATNDVPVPNGYRKMISDQPQSDAIVYLGGLVDTFAAVTSGFYYLWDELAVSVAAGETFANFEGMSLMVVVGGSEDGRTVQSDGVPAAVATGVEEPNLFYQHLLTTLAGSG
jgi:inosine-uridine nucleoside N-ribohydrolase